MEVVRMGTQVGGFLRCQCMAESMFPAPEPGGAQVVVGHGQAKGVLELGILPSCDVEVVKGPVHCWVGGARPRSGMYVKANGVRSPAASNVGNTCRWYSRAVDGCPITRYRTPSVFSQAAAVAVSPIRSMSSSHAQVSMASSGSPMVLNRSEKWWCVRAWFRTSPSS